MLVALVFVLARNIVKLVVERRRGLPFSRFRAKLVLAMLGLTIVPAVLVLIVGGELIRSSTERWFSEPIDDVLGSATQIAQRLLPRARGAVERHAARIARDGAAPTLVRRRRRRGGRGDCSQTGVTPAGVRRGRGLRARRARARPVPRRRRPSRRRRCRAARRTRRSDALAARVSRRAAPPSRIEPLEGGGELVRAGAARRDPRRAAGRRGRRERSPVRRAGDARAADHRGLRELQPAARAEAAAAGHLPVALPDDDADDSRQRDLDGPVPRQAHHAAGAAAGRGRARDRRRPPRSPHRARDARRVRLAVEAFNTMAGGAGGQPAQARALAARSRAEEPAARRAPALHRDGARADRHRRRVARRRRPHRDDQQRRAAPARRRPRASIGAPAERAVRARGSAAARSAAAPGARRRRTPAAQEIALVREGRELHLAAAATPLLREDGSARRRGAGVRRRDAADPDAAGRGVARRGAAARARDQEPADADPALRRAHAPALQRRRRRRRARWSRSARRPSSARSSRSRSWSTSSRSSRACRRRRRCPPISTRCSPTRWRSTTACSATIRIERRFATTLPPVRVDVEQIRRVVINLVDNAVEALGGGGAAPRPDGEPPTIVVETRHDRAQRRRADPRRRQRSRHLRPRIATSCSCRTTRPSGAAAASAWRSSAASSPSTAAASRSRDNVPHGFTIELPIVELAGCPSSAAGTRWPA